MAPTQISKDDAALFIHTVEACLRRGLPPPGIVPKRGTFGALRTAANLLGINPNSIGSHTLAAVAAFGREPDWRLYDPSPQPIPDVPDAAPAMEESERLFLKDRIKELERKLKAAYREEASGDQIRQAYFGLAEMQIEPPDWLLNDDVTLGGPGVPITIWSDWHWGEVVRPEEIGGVNEFNVDIAHERVRLLVSRIIDLSYNHQVNPTYPGIVVCLGGDMIGGEIHPELAETNELRTAPALLDLSGVLIWAINALADKFGRVFLPCVVGNHGRMTMKPRAKQRVATSFEWILYTMLERHFRDDPRIKFAIPEGISVHFTVAGTRYLLTHGDAMGVGGGNGIVGALGPIMRGRVKVGGAEAEVGREFDIMLIGHWHQLLMLPESGVIVNGALKGYDEFARIFLQAKFQRASQALWFTHPRVGITKLEPIYLQDRIEKAVANSILVFPQG